MDFIINSIKIIFLNFIIFSVLLILKRNLSPGILFYEGIYILIFSSIVLLTYYLKYKISSNNFKIHNVYAVFISFFLILSFHTTVITIVDRSISVFIISQINLEENTNESLKNKFNENFTKNAIDKRLLEQTKIGNVVDINSKLRLTKKGKIYANLFLLIKYLFNTDSNIFSVNSEFP
jgi:hypothetical protein